MELLFNAVFPTLLAGLFLIGLRGQALTELSKRPLLAMVAGVAAGIVYRRVGLPEIDGETSREAARFALSMLVFLAAQQCRVSRLIRVSPAAFRLSVLGTPLFFVIFGVAALIMIPGLDFWGLLIVATALVLGGAPSDDRALLGAPIADETKRAARIESAAALTLVLPIVVLLEIGTVPVSEGTALFRQPLFQGVAGFAVGAAIGLLAGRLLPLSKAALPVLPFLLGISVYLLALALGYDPVLACAGAGILYAEEAPLRGDVRTRLWRSGERILMPLSFVAFGFLLWPVIASNDLLLWVMAVVAVTLVKGVARFVALHGVELEPQDKHFLVWFGGSPGAPTALVMIALLASPLRSGPRRRHRARRGRGHCRRGARPAWFTATHDAPRTTNSPRPKKALQSSLATLHKDMAMADQPLLLDIDPRGVATLTLNRPRVRNALDDALLAALTQAIVQLARNADAKIIVLAANSDSFCAGTDITWMEHLAKQQPADDARRLANLLMQVRNCPKPTIARVHGPAIGAGVALAVAADIVVSADETHFALPAIRLGAVPAVIAPFIAEAIGVHHAKRYLMTGEDISAEEARRLGLVHAICHPAHLDATISRFIDDLLKGGPTALKETKALLNLFGSAPLDANLLNEAAKVSARIRKTDEAREGLAAFTEKRPADWVDR